MSSMFSMLCLRLPLDLPSTQAGRNRYYDQLCCEDLLLMAESTHTLKTVTQFTNIVAAKHILCLKFLII